MGVMVPERGSQDSASPHRTLLSLEELSQTLRTPEGPRVRAGLPDARPGPVQGHYKAEDAQELLWPGPS